jgi:uncharacterized protein
MSGWKAQPGAVAVSLVAVVLLAGCREHGESPLIRVPVARDRYVSFPALGVEPPLRVAARLGLPVVPEGQKVPAVVIAHGSGGVDSRGSFHAQALREAGIATLELDMWSARGLAGGAYGRPRAVRETLPDAYGALQFLSAHPAIDSSRIGITGFSWGGAMSMLLATRAVAERMAPPGPRFIAFAPFYPVCWIYNRVPGYELTEFTEGPVLLQAGGKDDYDAPDTCGRLVEGLPEPSRARVELWVYPEATHAWDRLEPELTVEDPMSHEGKGGPVRLLPSPQTAIQSRQLLVDFFRRTFGLGP